MPDEEDGFTFVDKRKTSIAVEPVDEPDSAAEPLGDSTSVEPETDSDDASSVYYLLQYVTQLLATDAWYRMGLVAHPATGVATVDLPQARVAIDTVADIVARLDAAPEGALEPAARRDLRNLLNDLRLNYVNQRQEAGSDGS